MRNKIVKPSAPCDTLRNGIAALARAAEAVYGTGRQVQYQSVQGGYRTSGAFSALLNDGGFEDRQIACAASVLREAGVPDDGVKTALILLDALLEKGACLNDAAWRQVSGMLVYAADFVERIAAENDGQAVGGGLALLTLCRPVQKYGRDHACEDASGVLAYALTQPMMKLAEAAGFEGYEVFERVKALAPNQFFSLHQVGIEHSIRVDAVHIDCICIGLDIREGAIRNLREQGVLEPAEMIQETLRFVDRALTAVLNIACIL